MAELICKYCAFYMGKKYCHHKENMDLRSSSTAKKKYLKQKRCKEEFCPLFKGE
jgi:hypothetical protein